MVICLERDADLHMAQLMPLPLTVSWFSKIQIGFTQWCIAKNGGGYTQRGVAKGLKVPCLFMIAEVSICCQKNPGGWYTPYTRVYPKKTPLVLPFWYQLTRVVLEKGPLNRCVCASFMSPSDAKTI